MARSPIYFAGGKRAFYENNKDLFPKLTSKMNYIEPFLGGGSVLFELEPKEAFVTDKNKELLNFYKILKKYPNDLIEEIKKFKDTKEEYLKVRAFDRDERYKDMNSVKRAARFYFLNQTSYKGLWRENAKGEMNAPYGYRNKDFYPDTQTLFEASRVLQNVKILRPPSNNYLSVEDFINGKSFVFLDPPLRKNEPSPRYRMSKEDFEDLRRFLEKIDRKKGKFLLLTENDFFSQELFTDKKWNQEVRADRRNIGPNIDSRKNELLVIRNYT